MAQSILLIEDDESIGEHLCDLLLGEGYVVHLRGNGLRALEFLRESDARPALIFLDLMMPVMDGVQFRREQLADSNLREIPVVVMTADAHIEQRRQQLAADAFLKKPLELREILRLAELYCGPQTKES